MRSCKLCEAPRGLCHSAGCRLHDALAGKSSHVLALCYLYIVGSSDRQTRTDRRQLPLRRAPIRWTLRLVALEALGFGGVRETFVWEKSEGCATERVFTGRYLPSLRAWLHLPFVSFARSCHG